MQEMLPLAVAEEVVCSIISDNLCPQKSSHNQRQYIAGVIDGLYMSERFSKAVRTSLYQKFVGGYEEIFEEVQVLDF